MSKLKVGVIGLGIGRGHVNAFNAHPDSEVVAIADLDATRLKTVSEKHGMKKLYEDAEKMIADEDLDIVSVATPNKFHNPLAIAALEKGAHVLCEKPMAMSAAEAKEMLDAGAKAGKRIMINFSYRFRTEAQCLKAQIDKGVFGDIYFAQTLWHRRRGMPGFGGWFGKKELAGGGPLIDLGVHRLDLALWFMGYPKPVWVMGSTYDHIASRIAKEQGKEYDVEDLAVGMVKFDNGATLEIEASWAANVEERERMETRLYGKDAGGIFRNLNEGYQDWETKIFLESEGQQFDLIPHKPIRGDGSSMQHFVNAIVNDTPHMATGEDGWIVMQILDAIYESAEKGEPVKIG